MPDQIKPFVISVAGLTCMTCMTCMTGCGAPGGRTASRWATGRKACRWTTCRISIVQEGLGPFRTPKLPEDAAAAVRALRPGSRTAR